MAGKISAIHEEKTQDRYSRNDTGSQNDTNWLAGKTNRGKRRLKLGHWPRSIISDDTCRIQNWTGQNSDQRFNTTNQRVLLTEKKHVPQPSWFLLDKGDQNGNTGGLLAETDRKWKRMQVRNFNRRRTTNIKTHDRNYGQKTPRQTTMKKKKTKLRKKRSKS